MAAKTAAGFLFTVKASQELTHARVGNSGECAQFLTALGPPISAKCFGCVLAQFPYSFHPEQGNGD